MYETIDENYQPYFNPKEMQKKRGFLVHLSTIYPWIRSLLKGVHRTLEVWRGKRDIDGWKFSDREVKIFTTNKIDESDEEINRLSSMMEFGKRRTDVIWDRLGLGLGLPLR